MEMRPFGATGLRIPVLGQGTWMMEREDPQACIRALRTGLDLGMTHVDTAASYGNGRVEELVGQALEGRRQETFLVSKVVPSHATYRGVLKACEQSLTRLRTEWLDCLLLHWPGAPLEETFAAFEKLVEQGKIRSAGVSNFDVGDLEEAAGLASPKTLACNQVLYHLEDRYIEQDVLPWCERNQVTIVAYSPFGHVRGFPPPGSFGGLVIRQIADELGATPRQVALRFLTRFERVCAIPKSCREDHVRENAGAADITLSAEHIRRIERAFPTLSASSELPML